MPPTTGTPPVQVQIDTRALAAFQKRVERYRGKPLLARMEAGAYEAAKMLLPSVRRAAPVGPTGNLRRGVRARQVRTMQNGMTSRMRTGSGVRSIMFMGALAAAQGQIASAYVGPSSRIAPHRHLVIRGHRIVTPGGRDTGRRSVPNPFVDNAVQPRQAEAIRIVTRAMFPPGG